MFCDQINKESSVKLVSLFWFAQNKSIFKNDEGLSM